MQVVAQTKDVDPGQKVPHVTGEGGSLSAGFSKGDAARLEMTLLHEKVHKLQAVRTL